MLRADGDFATGCYNRGVNSGTRSIFVVTGGAGFIGSHIVERLLRDQPGATVRVLDDFSTGSEANLPFAAAAGNRLEIARGDIRDLDTVERVATGASVIFHQAALRSVPRSVEDDHRRRSEEHTSELQSRFDLVCRLLLEKKKKKRK